MISYLFQLSLYWFVFYLIYILLFQRTTFFRLNRTYLLGTVIAGLLLPLIDFAAYMPRESIWQFNLPEIIIGSPLPELSGNTQESSSSVFAWCFLIWTLGSIVALGRTLHGILVINRLINSSKKSRQSFYTIVETEQLHLPFSFFNFLFWSRRFQPEMEEYQQILRHEEAHIRQWHSLDVIFIELLSVIFWWHPAVYAYRYSLRQVHEYLADAAVLRIAGRRQYVNLLIDPFQSGLQLSVANHFLRSQLKNRIIMMTKPDSSTSALLRYLLVLPLAAVLVLSCEMNFTTNAAINETEAPGQESDAQIPIDPTSGTELMESDRPEIFKVVEEMPRFPGCEEEPSDARNECAQMKMLTFIFENIKYPEQARQDKVEGIVVTRFVIDAMGNIRQPEIAKSLSKECDEEVLRIVAMMPRWIPGRQRGKAVAVQFNLPVKFRLDE